MTILTVFLFGTVPALRDNHLELAPSLKEGRGRHGRTHADRFLHNLVNLVGVDTGFDEQHMYAGSGGRWTDPVIVPGCPIGERDAGVNHNIVGPPF